jgi:hypothetical protein
MTVRHIFWRGWPGQSNTGGTPGSGEAGADIGGNLFWKDELGTGPATLGPLLGNASGGTGAAYTVGRILTAKAYRPIIVDIYLGSTAANGWIPGGAQYTAGLASLTAAWAAIQAAHPNDSFVHHHISDQGEYEARYGYPTPTGPEQAIIDAWATNYGLAHGVVESVVGTSADRFVVCTNYQLTNQNNAASFRALQISAAVVGTNDTRRAITRDQSDGVTYAGADGLHPNQAGYATYGEREAAVIMAVITLGSLGPALRTALVNHARDQGSYSPAATHYIHLYADAALSIPLTPGTAASYAPASNTNDATTWPAPAGRMVSNGVAFTFPTPSGTWPTVWGWKLTDSATEGAGAVLAQQAFSSGVAVSVATGAPQFATGAITITGEDNASIGGFADDVLHGLLGLAFGGTPYAPAWLTTTYGSYWAGDPDGAGAQAGSRVSMTQATTWGASGVTVAQVSLAQQATGTYWAEHDAAAAGNLLFTASRPAAVGADGIVLPGQIRTVIV